MNHYVLGTTTTRSATKINHDDTKNTAAVEPGRHEEHYGL
jgi:hypothetical protein